MTLIDDLKSEHTQILQLFEELEEAKYTDKSLTNELKEVAMTHLKKEDELLYPSLMESDKEEIRHTAKIFSDIVKKYSEEFLEVVDNLLTFENEVDEDAISDFEKIRDRIKDRIAIEETMLFASFDQR